MVELADGSTLTRADLPPTQTRRWVASRKAVVVKAVASGLLSAQEAQAMYGLGEEELEEWKSSAERFGERGLKATFVARGN